MKIEKITSPEETLRAAYRRLSNAEVAGEIRSSSTCPAYLAAALQVAAERLGQTLRPNLDVEGRKWVAYLVESMPEVAS